MKNKKMKKIGATLSSSVAALSMMLMNAVSASADAIEVNDNGKAAVVLADLSGLLKWINDLGDTAKYIGYAISVLAVIVAGIMLIGGGNGGMSKTRCIYSNTWRLSDTRLWSCYHSGFSGGNIERYAFY